MLQYIDRFCFLEAVINWPIDSYRRKYMKCTFSDSSVICFHRISVSIFLLEDICLYGDKTLFKMFYFLQCTTKQSFVDCQCNLEQLAP